MKVKNILLILIAVILIDWILLAYLWYQYNNLKIENNKLKEKIKILENKINNETNLNQNYKFVPNNNLTPHNIFKLPDINEFNDPFEEMQEIEKRMNQLFSQLDQNFSNKFEINITPKSWTYFHFSNTQIINWKKFSYTIDINDNKIKGKIIYDRIETLKQLQEKLEKLWVKTKLNWNTLKFWWKNVDINEILKLFNINFEENKINTEQSNKNWIRRF